MEVADAAEEEDGALEDVVGAAVATAVGDVVAVTREVPAEGEPAEGTTLAGSGRPAWIAFCCAENVVETMGQPTPGPLRFWSVTAAALRRASWEAVELSVGKVSATEGLCTAWPARTFAVRFYRNDVKYWIRRS